MSSYEGLAASYDALTTDVGLREAGGLCWKSSSAVAVSPVHTVLDLACGTGTMTWLLTDRGYELIGVDGSEEMLAAAMEKKRTGGGHPPSSCTSPCPQLDLFTALWTRPSAV